MVTIENVCIKVVSTSVPKSKVYNSDLSLVYGDDETKKLISSIGVNERRVTNEFTTSADLCFDAAENLFEKSEVNRQDVKAVIFVSQTSDYQLPATACILQDKLNLSKNTLAFDINMGCSGYVYGLQLAASLVNSGLNDVLLLVGDTISKLVKPGDRSTELLFGDAGTASIISFKENSKLSFRLGSDGAGYKHIIAKSPIGNTSLTGRANNYSYLEMDGGEVFSFTLKTIPKLINKFVDDLNLQPSDISNCFYHQANHFMLKHLSKKSKFTSQQVPISMNDFGNTSGASIPVTLCSRPQQDYKNTLLVGFGVGLSWGVVFCDLTSTTILPVKEYASV